MRPLMMATVCLTLTLGLPLLAHAETAPPAPTPRCAPTKFVAQTLERDYGELLVQQGDLSGGATLDVYASVVTGTFTIVWSMKVHGVEVSCPRTSGTGWRAVRSGEPA